MEGNTGMGDVEILWSNLFIQIGFSYQIHLFLCLSSLSPDGQSGEMEKGTGKSQFLKKTRKLNSSKRILFKFKVREEDAIFQ